MHLFDIKFATKNGKTYSLQMMGQAIFATIIVIANLKILCFAFSYSIALIILLVVSAVLGYITWYILHMFDLGPLEHSFTRLFPSVHYMVFNAFCLGLFILDYGFTKAWGMKELT